MKYYLCHTPEGRQLAGTQADAKALDPKFVEHHVPDDKDGRMTYVNNLFREIHEALKGKAADPVAAAPETPRLSSEQSLAAGADHAPGSAASEDSGTPARGVKMSDEQRARFETIARRMGWSPPGTVTAPQAAKIDAIEDEILKLEGNSLIRAVSAAVSRLGEIAGLHGWAAFAKNIYAWSPGSKSVEQGLGMLMLAALNHFGERPDVSDKATD